MARSQFPIPGHEHEKIIIFTRRHVASMLGVIFMVLFMVLIPILIIAITLSSNPGAFKGAILNFLWIGGSIYYLVVATFAFIEWMSYYYDIFIVTDSEIIDVSQEGIFDRRITEVTLLRVQDVSAEIKGFLPTLFSYGNVIAESAGENTKTYVIDSIPNPIEVANRILELHNEQISKEKREGELMTAEGDLMPVQKPYCPPCPPAQPNSLTQPTVIQSSGSAPVSNMQPAGTTKSFPVPPVPQSTQGEIKKNDLNQGGEVKF